MYKLKLKEPKEIKIDSDLIDQNVTAVQITIKGDEFSEYGKFFKEVQEDIGTFINWLTKYQDKVKVEDVNKQHLKHSEIVEIKEN